MLLPKRFNFYPMLNKWSIPCLFFFIFVFSTQLTVNKCSIKVCRWLDSNRGSLVSEATALPTEPSPPLPKSLLVDSASIDHSDEREARQLINYFAILLVLKLAEAAAAALHSVHTLLMGKSAGGHPPQTNASFSQEIRRRRESFQ